MPSHTVTKDELDLIRTAAKDAGVVNTTLAVANAIELIQSGEVPPEGLYAFFALAAARNPEWFQAVTEKAIDTDEHAEEIAAAFVGKGSPDARTKVLKSFGQVESDRLAVAHGLRGIGDFSKPGKAADGAKPPKAGSNPFADDSAAGEGRRISFIKSRGTRAASSLAAAVNRDIAGRPLRTAA